MILLLDFDSGEDIPFKSTEIISKIEIYKKYLSELKDIKMLEQYVDMNYMGSILNIYISII